MEDLDFHLIKSFENESAPPQKKRKSFSKSSFIHKNIKTALFQDCCKTCCTALTPKEKPPFPTPQQPLPAHAPPHPLK